MFIRLTTYCNTNVAHVPFSLSFQYQVLFHYWRPTIVKQNENFQEKLVLKQIKMLINKRTTTDIRSRVDSVLSYHPKVAGSKPAHVFHTLKL